MNASHAALPRQLARETGVSRDARWIELRGGRTNTCWQVQNGSTTFVCKLYSVASDNPLFPNNPDAEFAALTALTGCELAPSPIEFHRTSLGVCVFYEYLFARSEIPSSPRAIGQALANLHQTPITPQIEFRPLASSPSALLEHGHLILAQCHGSEVQTLIREAPLPRSLDGLPAVFLHGDLVPSNIITTSNGVRFIDWQCPAIGDPTHDLAIYLSPAMQLLYAGKVLSNVGAEEFLSGYNNPLVTERYHAIAPFFNWRMSCYALWKTQQGDMDYQAALRIERAAIRAASV
jgi:aminoglycoside phosphotransferase (APT) family kinase protein